MPFVLESNATTYNTIFKHVYGAYEVVSRLLHLHQNASPASCATC